MKLWEKRQAEKGYLTWSEYLEAVEEDNKEARKMSDRYTKTDAREALERLANHLGKRITRFDHTPEDIGSWYLDYNSIYGGAVIHEVVSSGYGVKTLGSRMKPYEFCQAIRLFYELSK